MRVLAEDELYKFEDSGNCPHCHAEIAELGTEVDDCDYRDGEDRDVAAIECPACGGEVALIRRHHYDLGKFTEQNEAT